MGKYCSAEAKRRGNLKYCYGMSLEQYDELLELQNGLCAICSSPDPKRSYSNFSVDHDHRCCPGARSCGECIRGLLCFECNIGLGKFHDKSDLLRHAAEYLEQR